MIGNYNQYYPSYITVPMTSIQQAIVLHQAGKLGDAEALYRQILECSPCEFDALHMLGIICAQREQYGEAERLLRAALCVDDKVPPCLHNYGNVLSKLHRYEEAIDAYNKALALAPNYPPLYSDRGNAQKELNRNEAALASYDRALALRPDFAQAHYNRGLVLAQLYRADEALLSYDRALALDPNYALAHCGRGDTLKELGRFDQALAAFERSIALNSSSGVAYASLAMCKAFTRGDPHLAAMELLAARAEGLSKDDCMHLDFALAKAYDDVKDYTRSFRHLSAANAARRAVLRYDEQMEIRFFDAVMRIFSADLLTMKAGSGASSRRPIFVLGMPRSGTTLIEQILASHPDVHGAGELTLLTNILLGDIATSTQYPEIVPMLDRAALMAIGDKYIKRLSALATTAKHITDKSPVNFLHIGLIHLALPNAVIIHCQRDPVDTCLSCYSKLFRFGQQNYAYDLGELGRYYTRYQCLMKHWRDVLPPHRMLEVRYEDVVVDLEGQTRRLLDHCRLTFDKRCLSFYKTVRPVHTASATQVRQPIYNSAVGRWRRYEEFIKPLLNELGTIAADAGTLC